MLPSLVAGLVCGGFYLNLHRQAAAMLPENLPLVAPPLGPQKRLLVLSPHCDDETLGVGGLISEASASRTPVTVAFLTNGDGFRVAAVRTFHKPVPTPLRAVPQHRRPKSWRSSKSSRPAAGIAGFTTTSSIA